MKRGRRKVDPTGAAFQDWPVGVETQDHIWRMARAARRCHPGYARSMIAEEHEQRGPAVARQPFDQVAQHGVAALQVAQIGVEPSACVSRIVAVPRPMVLHRHRVDQRRLRGAVDEIDERGAQGPVVDIASATGRDRGEPLLADHAVEADRGHQPVTAEQLATIRTVVRLHLRMR